MNEMQVLRRLRDDVPASLPVTHAETVLLTAIRAEAAAPAAPAGKFFPGRTTAARVSGRLRLALAGGLSLSLAAGITAAVVIPGPGPAPDPKTSRAVRVLAYHAAKAASAQPKVSADHWVYWQEQNGSGAKAHIWRVWTTADGQKAAYRHHGRVHMIQNYGVKFFHDGQFVGQPVISFGRPPYGGVSVGALFGKIPVRYADLRKLPGDPRALVDYLGHLPMPGWGQPAARAFEIITELIQTYVMPPKLTAELYRALADIPGVTVDKDVVDVAGKHGIGFVFGTTRGYTQQLVLNRDTYRLMAIQLVRDKRGPDFNVGFDGGVAILRMALVKGPGVLP